jgi:hypothetical protein
MQYCELEIFMQSINEQNDRDRWRYIRGNGNYSSSKAYRHLTRSQQIHPAYRWLWVSSCQSKHKVFYSLLLKISVNTRGLMRKKNMPLDPFDCELCLLQREVKL